jgi:hypothetical protein
VLDEDEPVLTPVFEEQWHETTAGIVGDSDRLRAAAPEVLSVDAGAVAVECADEGGVTLTAGGGWTGDWPSRAALAADLASERLLADRGVAELDRLDVRRPPTSPTTPSIPAVGRQRSSPSRVRAVIHGLSSSAPHQRRSHLGRDQRDPGGDAG